MARQAGLDWSDAAVSTRVRTGEEIAFCAEMIALELPDRAALRVVAPQIVFDERLELRLGSVTLTVAHVGGDHAADSVVIHVEEDRLLFLGDCLYQRLYAEEPHLTVAGIRGLVHRIRAFGAVRAIEGHRDTLHDAGSLAVLLDEFDAAADLVERDGASSLASARSDDERELLGFLVAGLAVN